MTFKNYLNNKPLTEKEITLLWSFMLDEDLSNNLNESADSITTKVEPHLKKVGLKLHKHTGLVDYVMKFLKGSGKLFYYLMKGDHDKAKELLRGIKKEDVLDFLFKLDLGTLHLFTGPIHMIDAWTGWDLSVNLSSNIKKAEELAKDFQNAIIVIKDVISNSFSKQPKTKLLKCVNKLENGLVKNI
jgi:ribosome-associated translation inhibitor RaiA